MSVVHLPSVRSYWSNNMGNRIIKNTMTVNRFEKIKHFLHFNNNKLNFGLDRLYKIRPLIETLRKFFISIPLEECLSVDDLCNEKSTLSEKVCSMQAT